MEEKNSFISADRVIVSKNDVPINELIERLEEIFNSISMIVRNNQSTISNQTNVENNVTGQGVQMFPSSVDDTQKEKSS